MSKKRNVTPKTSFSYGFWGFILLKFHSLFLRVFLSCWTMSSSEDEEQQTSSANEEEQSSQDGDEVQSSRDDGEQKTFRELVCFNFKILKYSTFSGSLWCTLWGLRTSWLETTDQGSIGSNTAGSWRQGCNWFGRNWVFFWKSNL